MMRLHFSVGGDELPFTVDSLASGQIELRRNHSAEIETVEIPEERWERFWNELDRIPVWKWKKKYTRKSRDGTSWELQIAHDDRTLNVTGRNAFPEADDPAGEASYPPGGQFDRLIQAISRLVGIPVDQIGSEPSDYD